MDRDLSVDPAFLTNRALVSFGQRVDVLSSRQISIHRVDNAIIF